VLLSLIPFVTSTLSLITFCLLGVCGVVTDVCVVDVGVIGVVHAYPRGAIGGFAYTDEYSTTMQHEYGHLVHERELGALYPMVAGMSSIIGNLLVAVGIWSPDQYYQMWTERKADEYGGVVR
jgi:hypothetical protein